jgi:hypothetical protein
MKTNGFHISDTEREQVIRLLTTHGKTVREVAEIHNRTERAIRIIAKGAGIVLARHKPTAKQRHEISLSLSDSLMVALAAAAKRRDLEPSELAVLILSGVVSKGSIYHALHGLPLHHHTSL